MTRPEMVPCLDCLGSGEDPNSDHRARCLRCGGSAEIPADSLTLVDRITVVDMYDGSDDELTREYGLTPAEIASARALNDAIYTRPSHIATILAMLNGGA